MEIEEKITNDINEKRKEYNIQAFQIIKYKGFYLVKGIKKNIPRYGFGMPFTAIYTLDGNSLIDIRDDKIIIPFSDYSFKMASFLDPSSCHLCYCDESGVITEILCFQKEEENELLNHLGISVLDRNKKQYLYRWNSKEISFGYSSIDFDFDPEDKENIHGIATIDITGRFNSKFKTITLIGVIDSLGVPVSPFYYSEENVTTFYHIEGFTPEAIKAECEKIVIALNKELEHKHQRESFGVETLNRLLRSYGLNKKN